MHIEIGVVLVAAVADALFFVSAGVICDALYAARRHASVVGELVAYVAFVALVE